MTPPGSTRLALARTAGAIFASCLVILLTNLMVAPPAQAVAQSVYPKYLTASHVGAESADSGRYGNLPPSDVFVLPAHAISLETGLINDSRSAQKVTVKFGYDCFGSHGEVMAFGPTITLTVPGDPSQGVPGQAIMARVKGKLTLPSTCDHASGSRTDGNLISRVTGVGTTGGAGDQNEAFKSSALIPGAGFPAGAGATVLWRAVDASELDAIKAAGNRYTLGLGNMGKYFYPTKAQAEALASKYEGLGYGNYTVTSASVQDSVFGGAAVDSIAPAGEGDAWFFLEDAVAVIEDVAIIE